MDSATTEHIHITTATTDHDDDFTKALAEAGDDETTSERPQKKQRSSSDDDTELMPLPPPLALDYDLGPNAFDAFGFPYVVSRGIEANIEYKSPLSAMVLSVTMEITNESYLNEISPTLASEIRRIWFAHATDWPTRRRAVFKGACAAALAVFVQACLEVRFPGYGEQVLVTYIPEAVRNGFANPYNGSLDAEAHKENWRRRNNEITSLVVNLNIRVARKHWKELAQMYKNRRTQKSVFERGTTWEHNTDYINAACKKETESFDLERAVLTLYVYIVQIDAWSATLKGDKTNLTKSVTCLRDEFVKAFKQQFKV